ncbi:hypothetical protein R4Z09_17275 [Niallia oryzisoli]|uniref:Uncharacterized protein n=1 Tax=Niallia oryzisoli TaxID=1737571 RepID=A0ABZ2CAM0_9BACI
MLLVCRNHVTDGLKEISAPHIEKVPPENNTNCAFCMDKAVYRLFYFRPLPVKEKELVKTTANQS